MRYSHSLTIWRWKMRLRGRYWLGRRVNLETLGDDMWMAQFRCVDSHEPWNTYFLISLQPLRFTSVQIEESLRVLDLPSIIHCSESHNEDSQTALCMPLVWLAHPSRQCDFEMQFGWERTRFFTNNPSNCKVALRIPYFPSWWVSSILWGLRRGKRSISWWNGLLSSLRACCSWHSGGSWTTMTLWIWSQPTTAQHGKATWWLHAHCLLYTSKPCYLILLKTQITE